MQNREGDSFENRLRAEISVWKDAGIIESEVGDRILAHYGPGAVQGSDDRRLNRLVLILSVLGGVLSGLGVILFVASNWEEFSRPTRILLILGTLVSVHGAGFWIRYRSSVPRVAAGIVLLGSLVYGAGVFLIGQAYHVPVEEPYLYLLWALGVLPMAYITVSRPTLLLSILVLMAWYGALVGRWDIEFASGQLALAFLSLGATVLWLGEVHGALALGHRFAPVLTTVGLIISMVVIFMLTNVDLWREFDRSGQSGGLGAQPVPFVTSLVILTVSAVGLIAGAVWLRKGSRIVASQAGGTVGAFLFTSLLFVTSPFETGAPYAITFNVLAAGMVIWAVWIGLWSRREGFVNAGLAFAGLLIFARYLDLSFSLFDRSFVFIGGGLLLIAAAIGLERTRKVLFGLNPSRHDDDGAAL